SPRGSRLDGSVSFSADVLKELLASEELTPTEKLLYAILATQSRRAPRGFALPQGSFTYRSLSRLTGWDPRTVRTAVCTLANQGWLGLSQENRRQPIHFTLQDPHTAESLGELARMQDRLLNA